MIAALAAVITLWREGEVRSSQIALKREAFEIRLGRLPPTVPINRANGTARVFLIDGLRNLRWAEVTPDLHARKSLLDRAETLLSQAQVSRPKWGEVTLARAYAQSLRTGNDARTLDLLAQSYREAPYLRGAATWRVGVGFERWNELDPTLREAVLNEALWVSDASYEIQQAVLDRARQSEAYADFFSRWHSQRMARRRD